MENENTQLEQNAIEETTEERPTILTILTVFGAFCLGIGLLGTFLSFVSCVNEETPFNPLFLALALSSIFIFALQTIIDLLYKINKNLNCQKDENINE